jgi:radical SAM superfamily enzyme YgiQ (UPF0313 family)
MSEIIVKVPRRGREAAAKLFPVITPAKSDFRIRDVLVGANSEAIRHERESSGLVGSTDILLAFPLPSPSSPQKNQPLGLFYVGESARSYGFEVGYWDARHDSSEEEFLQRAASANFVGFSAITGWQLSETLRLVRKLRMKRPSIKIILGGAHATLTNPKVNLEGSSYFDYLVFGESELRLPALMRAVYRNDGSITQVDGIAYRTNGGIVVQKNVHVPDLERDLPQAVTAFTIRYFKEAARRNEVILPTSRGCPWSTDSCDFCSVGMQYMDSYRKVPFRIWKADIEAVLAVQPFTHIELEDENSATAIKESEPYLPFLKEKGITTHLHLRSDQLLDAKRVQWMKDMGVIRVHVGIESGSERVLNEVMHKHESVSTHFVAARNLAASNIELVATYIVANPTETWNEIRATLQVADDLKQVFPPQGSRATVYVLAAFPGTPIFSDISSMHDFCTLLDGLERECVLGYDDTFPIDVRVRERLTPWLKEKSKRDCGTPSPKAADTVQPALAAFLSGEGTFATLKSESRKWLWPMPNSIEDWAKSSAAYNPLLPAHWNAIYLVAGMHFNKAHKTAQNFPGWKRLLIKPFELLFDVRFTLAVKYGFEWALKGTGFEMYFVSRLINWAAQRSVGQELDRAHSVKIMEGYSKTLAGH